MSGKKVFSVVASLVLLVGLLLPHGMSVMASDEENRVWDSVAAQTNSYTLPISDIAEFELNFKAKFQFTAETTQTWHGLSILTHVKGDDKNLFKIQRNFLGSETAGHGTYDFRAADYEDQWIDVSLLVSDGKALININGSTWRQAAALVPTAAGKIIIAGEGVAFQLDDIVVKTYTKTTYTNDFSANASGTSAAYSGDNTFAINHTAPNYLLKFKVKAGASNGGGFTIRVRETATTNPKGYGMANFRTNYIGTMNENGQTVGGRSDIGISNWQNTWMTVSVLVSGKDMLIVGEGKATAVPSIYDTIEQVVFRPRSATIYLDDIIIQTPEVIFEEDFEDQGDNNDNNNNDNNDNNNDNDNNDNNNDNDNNDNNNDNDNNDNNNDNNDDNNNNDGNEEKGYEDLVLDFEDANALSKFNDPKGLLSIVADPKDASNKVLKYHATGQNWGNAILNTDVYDDFVLTAKIYWGASEFTGSGNFAMGFRVVEGKGFGGLSLEMSHWASRFYATINTEGSITNAQYDNTFNLKEKWMELKVVVEGNTAKVYLDDTLKATYDNEFVMNEEGVIRLGSWTDGNVVVYLDDFSIKHQDTDSDDKTDEKEEEGTFKDLVLDFENSKDLDNFNDPKGLLSIVEDPKDASNKVLKYHATGQNWGNAILNTDVYDDFVLTAKIYWGASEFTGSGNFAMGFRVVEGKGFGGLSLEMSHWASRFYATINTEGSITSAKYDSTFNLKEKWLDLKVVVKGNTAKVYLNGTLKATYDNEFVMNEEGVIRLGSWTDGNVVAYLDDFSITHEDTDSNEPEKETFKEVGLKFEDSKDLDSFNDPKGLLSIVTDPKNSANKVLKYHATSKNWGNAILNTDEYDNFVLTAKIYLPASENKGSGSFGIGFRVIEGKGYGGLSLELSNWASRFYATVNTNGTITNQRYDSTFKLQEKWMNLKVVVSGNTAKVYLDGTLKATYDNEFVMNEKGVIRFGSWTDGDLTVYLDDLIVTQGSENPKTGTANTVPYGVAVMVVAGALLWVYGRKNIVAA